MTGTYFSLSIPINPSQSLSSIDKEIKGLLDLIYGEDCMMGRQIRGLEAKGIADKTLPRGDMIRRVERKMRASDDRFWKLAKERFGIEKDEKGIIRKKKDKEGEKKEEGKKEGEVKKDEEGKKEGEVKKDEEGKKEGEQ